MLGPSSLMQSKKIEKEKKSSLHNKQFLFHNFELIAFKTFKC